MNPTELLGFITSHSALSQVGLLSVPQAWKAHSYRHAFSLWRAYPWSILKNCFLSFMTRVKHLLSSEAFPEPPVPIPRQSLRSLYLHSICASPACLPHTGSRGALGTEPTTETTTFLLSPLQLLNKVFGTLQPSINFSWKKKIDDVTHSWPSQVSFHSPSFHETCICECTHRYLLQPIVLGWEKNSKIVYSLPKSWQAKIQRPRFPDKRPFSPVYDCRKVSVINLPQNRMPIV